MSDTIVQNNALTALRRAYTLGLTPNDPDWTLRLFTNNRMPLCTDTFANYTECTLAGYAPVSLSPGLWTGSLAACVDTWNYPTQTFMVSSGGQTIFGHLVYDATHGVLAWVDLWEVPFAVPAGGALIDVALKWTDKQC